MFSYLFIVVLGTDVVNTANCNYEPLPDSFDSLSYLKFNNEFHLQGEFLANFTVYYDLINFTISQDSVVRAYVAPHDADVDIWLYNFTSGSGINLLFVYTKYVQPKLLPIRRLQLELRKSLCLLYHRVFTP